MKATLLALALSMLAQAAPWPPADYALCYGSFSPEMVARAHAFQLVVVHPGDNFDNLTPQQVAQIKAGKDGQAGTSDDVWVLGYVSIGEDDKPPAGPPKLPKGPGPVHFVKSAWKSTQGGYPSRFVDEQAYVFEANGERKYGEDGKPVSQAGQDGVPDENGVWGSYYVNPGDPDWHNLVLGKMQRLDQEWGVDGYFLDTLDTASPWGNYAYTQPQMAALLQKIRKTHPSKKIIGNRGMFLLEKHSQAYRESLDGVLYESLYSIWDWAASKGILSPWAAGDYNYLRELVLPAANQKPGFHMFYVNYLNPQQTDFYAFLHSIEDVLGRNGLSNYVSDPLLQGLQPPLAELFPERGEGPPEFGSLSLKELPLGRFELSYQYNENEGKLGQDLFLDVRLSKEKKTGPEISLLDPLPINYTTPGKLYGSGLEKGSTYYVYARLVGKTRTRRSNFLEVSFATSQGPQPAQLEKLKSVGREQSVQLTWQGSTGKYRVYQGSDPWNLAAVKDVIQPEAVLQGLSNGQPIYVAVSALDALGREGALCKPLLTRADDCTPPNSPTSVTANAQGAHLSVAWEAVPEAATYKVYCTLAGEKFRIPLRVDSTTLQVELGQLAKGDYEIWVTAADAAGNESRRNQRIQVKIR